VFENEVLRNIFGPKEGETGRRWRKLHSKELHNLYALPDNFLITKSRKRDGRNL
jgi:hypothetical protein